MLGLAAHVANRPAPPRSPKAPVPVRRTLSPTPDSNLKSIFMPRTRSSARPLGRRVPGRHTDRQVGELGMGEAIVGGIARRRPLMGDAASAAGAGDPTA